MTKKILAAFIIIMCFLSLGCDNKETFSPDGNGGLYINEVVSKNAYSLIDENLGTPDWIEIYNGASHAISLKGYGLSDNINRPFMWKFPNITIEAGGYIVVYASPKSHEDIEENSICTGFKVSSLGETLILTSPEGSLIQELKVPPLPADVSWGRNKDGGYCYYSRPSPGENNGEFGMDDLEDIIQSAPLGAVRINELMVDNTDSIADSSGDKSGWAEICNVSDEPVSLDGYFITDNPSNSAKWRFPDVTLAPEEYIIVFLSGKDIIDGELHTNFRLNKQEKGLWLINPAGALEDKIQWRDTPPESFSMGRNAQGGFVYFGLPTPGEPNGENGVESLEYSVVSTLGDIRINEFLIGNKYSRIDGDGDRTAWAELYNASAQTISLADYAISDNKSSPAKWRFPNVEIEPGEYLVVFLSGKNKKVSKSELHTSFVLSKNDKELMLTNLRDMEYEITVLPDTLIDNVSYGRAADDIEKWVYFAQPTPGQQNTTKGFEDIFNVAALDGDGIWINEVSAVSYAKSGKLDWIEIANGGDGDISLKGYYLSDNDNNPYKWKVPDVTVPAGGYAVIYASSKPSVQSGKHNIAKLGVTYTGELLMLSSPEGNTLDVFETGVLRPDVTSGRASGDYSGARVFFQTPTPGDANKDEISSYAQKPMFSRPGGYAQGTVMLEMKCGTPEAKIYYTLDGSKPTRSSNLYTGPVKLNNTAVVKAVSYAENSLKSEMMVATYIFDEKYTVPVVCLSANPRDFSKAYNVTERKDRNEQEGYIEFYESDGTLGVAFPAGMRASGSGTLKHAQKSLKLYLRGGYGQSSVTYPFFKDFPYVTFESLTLRSSGQDKEFARVRDAFCHMASREMDVDYAEYRLVVLYVNGQYFGLYDLRENQNAAYYAYRYNTISDNIERIRWNKDALDGTADEILAVRSFARSYNMANEDNFAEFCKKVDAQAAMDYLIAETFFCNSDMFNQKYSRAVDYSFKWRFVLFDFDHCMFDSNRSLLRRFFDPKGVLTAHGYITNMDIQCALLQNPGWKEAFIERYAYVLNNIYTKDKLLALFDEMTAEMEPEMEKHIRKWGWPRSVTRWKSDVKELRGFLEVRTQNVKKHLKDFFKLSSDRMDELFPNG